MRRQTRIRCSELGGAGFRAGPIIGAARSVPRLSRCGVQNGHHQIEKNEIDRMFAKEPQGLARLGGADQRRKTFAFENALQQRDIGGLVVDDQDRRSAHDIGGICHGPDISLKRCRTDIKPRGQIKGDAYGGLPSQPVLPPPLQARARSTWKVAPPSPLLKPSVPPMASIRCFDSPSPRPVRSWLIRSAPSRSNGVKSRATRLAGIRDRYR